MGGQIILETYARMPERISALVFLTAPFESPLRTFYGRGIDRVYRLTNHVIRSMPRPAVLLWRALFLADPALSNRIAQLVRALGPNSKVEDMAPYYRHLAYLDPLVILKMAEAMHQHSAGQILVQVRVPTLILSGANDTFTPPILAEAMAEAIPNAETAVVRDATHGAIIEKPEEVNAFVRSFLASQDPIRKGRARTPEEPERPRALSRRRRGGTRRRPPRGDGRSGPGVADAG